jgi:hypothetical protein
LLTKSGTDGLVAEWDEALLELIQNYAENCAYQIGVYEAD